MRFIYDNWYCRYPGKYSNLINDNANRLRVSPFSSSLSFRCLCKWRVTISLTSMSCSFSVSFFRIIRCEGLFAIVHSHIIFTCMRYRSSFTSNFRYRDLDTPKNKGLKKIYKSIMHHYFFVFLVFKVFTRLLLKGKIWKVEEQSLTGDLFSKNKRNDSSNILTEILSIRSPCYLYLVVSRLSIRGKAWKTIFR